MNTKEFNLRRDAIIERFRVAYNYKCYRTARARLHELANLLCEWHTHSDPLSTYKSLLKKYDVSDKISNIS